MDTLQLALLATASYLMYLIALSIHNVYFHPLSTFPGPRLAACSTLWKAYIDCVSNTSFVATLESLHKQHGDVVRVGPNELHFSRPETYHEIYNANNRWDKEESLYHSFGEDNSSFGYLAYRDAKDRKDILARCFSRRAIREAEELVMGNVTALCRSFDRMQGKPVDLFYAFRCMSMDVITSLCFGKSVNAVDAPNHKAPIILAMDASGPVFARFKHAAWYKNMILSCPPKLSLILAPETAGLINLQQALKQQIAEVTSDPEGLKKLPHNKTVYHQLLDQDNYRDKSVPDPGSLYEESQALMFGGADTTGTTLMHGTFCILKSPEAYARLKQELQQAWPRPDQPSALAELEQLPYLTAVIKESMRMSPGVASPLPRVVPRAGATLARRQIPGGTIVEMSSHFVHRNADIFHDPDSFRPERWQGPQGKDLERWLVNFSKGPRSCLGFNLAWAELYLTFAHVFRRYDLALDPSSPRELVWRDVFLPQYIGPHLKAKMTPVTE